MTEEKIPQELVVYLLAIIFVGSISLIISKNNILFSLLLMIVLTLTLLYVEIENSKEDLK